MRYYHLKVVDGLYQLTEEQECNINTNEYASGVDDIITTKKDGFDSFITFNGKGCNLIQFIIQSLDLICSIRSIGIISPLFDQIKIKNSDKVKNVNDLIYNHNLELNRIPSNHFFISDSFKIAIPSKSNLIDLFTHITKSINIYLDKYRNIIKTMDIVIDNNNISYNDIHGKKCIMSCTKGIVYINGKTMSFDDLESSLPCYEGFYIIMYLIETLYANCDYQSHTTLLN